MGSNPTPSATPVRIICSLASIGRCLLTTTVLIIGLGDVGAWALEFLARAPGVDAIAVADIRADWGRYRTNLAAIGAGMNGQEKSFSFHAVDLSDVSRTAGVLEEVSPDVVINVSSLLSPRSVTEQLRQIPGEVGEQARAALGIGAQLPWHLAPAYSVMKARERANPDVPVVNVSFADGVNPMLWGAELGAVCGAGNCEHLAYEIRRVVAAEHNRDQSAVHVYLVSGGSAMLHAGPSKMPYFLKLTAGGEDVTSQYDPNILIEDAIGSRFYSGEGGVPIFSTPAASAVKNALAIAHDTREVMTVNSPLGLPGDYPASLGANGAELELPKEISREEAESIGRAALPLFGIAEVRGDGTALYTEETRGRLKDLLGYDCAGIHPSEAWARARELMDAYRRFLDDVT